MKMNEDKSNLLFFASKDEVSVSISASLIPESDDEKLLGLNTRQKTEFQKPR